MAVTYNKVGFTLIEKGLRDWINNDFNNVFISKDFKMKGNECVRINLTNSTNMFTLGTFEQREYSVEVRYYFNRDIMGDGINENVKGKVDRLRKKILDKAVNGSSWSYLDIDNIEYDIQDDENENNNIYIVQLDLTLINHNVLN